MSRPNYDIFINGVEKKNVLWGKGNARKYDYKLSYELAGSFIFQGADAREIILADITTTYDVLITRNGSTWFTGSFRKIDCTIDEDEESVEVSFKKEDDYTLLRDNLNKEFNIIKDLGCPTTSIQYDNKTLIQFYIRHSGKIINMVNGFSYETDTDASITDLTNDGFELIGKRFVVSGAAESHDAYGVYDTNGQKGDFLLLLADEGPLKYLYLKDGGDVIRKALFVTNPFGQGLIDQGLSLVSGDTIHHDNIGLNGIATSLYDPADVLETSKFMRAYAYPIYARVLTEKTTFNGISTIAVDTETDVTNSGYSYRLGYNTALLTGFPFNFGYAHATTSGFDVVPMTSINNPGAFYIKNGTAVLQSMWFENSIFYSGALDLSSGDTITTINHAYSFYNIIKYWFIWRGGTIIPSIPAPHDLYLVPSTNITTNEYDIAAKKGLTTMAEVLDALMHCLRLDHHIDIGILHFKPFNYYENLPVGLDLQSSIEPKSGRNWGYRSKKYTYKKEDIPERLEFKFHTRSSDLFNGRPIVHKSPFVAQENKKSLNVSYFTDLQWALSNPTEVSKDSLIMLYGDLAGKVKYQTIDGVSIQNGDLSWTHIHPTYYKDNAACEVIEINDVETTANSILKTKIQKISIPIDEFVPLRSILTALGDGRVASINEDMLTGISDIELYHDI